MLKRLLRLSRYPAILVFFLAGALAILLAFSSYNLFQMGMANLHFIERYGRTALAEGALWQLVEILGYGTISLLCYLGFKACETDLMTRFRRWQDS
jgi:hypothetical protein